MSKDGGPAFPVTNLDVMKTHMYGMSLRDFFAAKAMQGMLAALPVANSAELAGHAYGMADAMLKEREKG